MIHKELRVRSAIMNPYESSNITAAWAVDRGFVYIVGSLWGALGVPLGSLLLPLGCPWAPCGRLGAPGGSLSDTLALKYDACA